MKHAFLWIAVLSILVAGSVFAAEPGGSAGFPPAGIDVIHHELKVAVRQVAADGSDGKELEVLLFKGQMLIERQDPHVNPDGLRQIDFLVKNWQAVSYSEALDSVITYKLTEGRPQRMSHIVAQQQDSDYPAKFLFNVKFDAVAYGETFFEELDGTPIESGFFEVPPSGNRRTSPTMRTFETERIEMDHPELGRIRFVPIECNDSSGETVFTFSAKGEKAAA